MFRLPSLQVHRITGALLLGVLSLVFYRPGDAAAQIPHDHEPRNSSEPFIVSDHVTSIPYFTLRDGMSSQLTLFNSAPGVTKVTLTISNTEGRQYSPPPIVVDAHSFKVVELQDLVPGRDFDSGSIEVAFPGINMMAVTVQISIYSREQRVLVESRHLHAFMSSVLAGIVYLPDAEAEGHLAVTNAGKNQRKIHLAIGPRKQEITLLGRQTRLIKLNGEMDLRRLTPSLIRLEHDGLPGDVIATGFVLDLKRGYSATIAMIDPAIMRSNKLAGAHFRFGQQVAAGDSNDGEGFPKNTRFRAPLLLANLGSTPVTAQISVDYTVRGPEPSVKTNSRKEQNQDDKVSTVSVKRLTIRAGNVETIELSRELAALVAGPVSESGVDIAYDGAPGQIIGQLTTVDESGDYSFEVPIKDPSALDKMMEGGYPWTLENGKNTTVYLKNTTGEIAQADGVIAFPNGAKYNLLQIELQPYQTFAIDLKELKDSKEADWKGQEFPADAAHGQFYWRQEIPYTIIGRAETLNLKDGIASSFTCDTGCCIHQEEDKYFEPSSYTGQVGATINISAERLKISCGGIEYITPTGISWTSLDSNVVQNSSGALLVGAGSTWIQGMVHLKEYYKEDGVCHWDEHHPMRSAQVQAIMPSPSLSCTPSTVTRGGATITCTVSNSTTRSNWRFTPSGSGTPTVTRTTDTGIATWQGIMVTSGTVAVTANGSVALSFVVTVTNRNFHTSAATATPANNGTFDTLPCMSGTGCQGVPPAPVGNNSRLGVAQWSASLSSYTYSTITDNGPNHSYTYFPSNINWAVFDFRYIINPDLENSSSTFSQKQWGACGYISYSNLLTQTNRHEYNHATQSHHGIYSISLNANNPGDYYEQRVGPPGVVINTFLSETTDGINARLGIMSVETLVEPYAVNESATGTFLGNINYAPYTPCP